MILFRCYYVLFSTHLLGASFKVEEANVQLPEILKGLRYLLLHGESGGKKGGRVVKARGDSDTRRKPTELTSLG